MAVQTEETFLESKRDRLQKQREDLHAKRAEIDDQLAAIDQELYALDVYVQAKAGKRFDLAPQKAPRAPSTRAPRGKRAEIRKQIIDLVTSFPSGASAETINSELEITDDKKAKQAVANLLAMMKKDGTLSQDGKRGSLYTIGVPQAPDAP